jgi:hypothetical protein
VRVMVFWPSEATWGSTGTRAIGVPDGVGSNKS